MKKILLLLIVCLATLVLFTACSGERGDLLYAVDYDGLTYCVRGDGTQAEQIVVKEGETLLFCQNVDVDESIGNYKETFGFFADDLNFDGYRDLSIATAKDGDCYTYCCYLFDPATKNYVASPALNQLYNVKADAKLKAVFGFTHTETVDTATMYEWVGNSLYPLMKASITYYAETDLYLYSVAYYNAATQEYEDDYGTEDWMTPEEYNEVDKSIIFYFK